MIYKIVIDYTQNFLSLNGRSCSKADWHYLSFYGYIVAKQTVQQVYKFYLSNPTQYQGIKNFPHAVSD